MKQAIARKLSQIISAKATDIPGTTKIFVGSQPVPQELKK